jgi:hypothetical protein
MGGTKKCLSLALEASFMAVRDTVMAAGAAFFCGATFGDGRRLQVRAFPAAAGKKSQ